MMREGIREHEDTTMSRFLSGLSLEIKDRVELLPYQDLNDLVQLCIKVEQVKERPSKSFKEKEKPREGTSTHTHTSDMKCFKCLGRGHNFSMTHQKDHDS